MCQKQVIAASLFSPKQGLGLPIHVKMLCILSHKCYDTLLVLLISSILIAYWVCSPPAVRTQLRGVLRVALAAGGPGDGVPAQQLATVEGRPHGNTANPTRTCISVATDIGFRIFYTLQSN